MYRYLMTFWCKFFMRVLIFNLRIFRLASLLVECSCVAPLTSVVIEMRWLVFQPLFCMVLISESYFI
jgi:hypothetical protein